MKLNGINDRDLNSEFNTMTSLQYGLIESLQACNLFNKDEESETIHSKMP